MIYDRTSPKHNDLLISEHSKALSEMADHDNEEDRKMFVGGLPQDVSQEDLQEYFGSFGELESVKLKMDPMTGRSRGFAFLLYKDEESINNAAENKDHKLKVKKGWHKKNSFFIFVVG